MHKYTPIYYTCPARNPTESEKNTRKPPQVVFVIYNMSDARRPTSTYRCATLLTPYTPRLYLFGRNLCLCVRATECVNAHACRRRRSASPLSVRPCLPFQAIIVPFPLPPPPPVDTLVRRTCEQTRCTDRACCCCCCWSGDSDTNQSARARLYCVCRRAHEKHI